VVADQLIPGSTGADLADTVVAAPAAGHLGHRTMISNRVSNRSGPGDASVGSLALASTDPLAGVVESVGRSGVATIQIPMTGAKNEGFLALAVVDHTVAWGHCHLLAAAGCLANGCGLTNHTPGYSADGLSGLEI